MTAELHEALVAALGDLCVIDRGNTATIPTKDGRSFTYTYADLADVVAATRPVLAAHGLVALTPLTNHEDGPAVAVVILHRSGQSLTFGPFPFREGHDAQATGSAVTYHRRYALLAALGIATGDDDDGAAASPHHDTTGSSTGSPSDAQLRFARDLADRLGDAAVSVVPSIVEEVTGRRAKLSELTRFELSRVIDELRDATESDAAIRYADAEARAAAGAEAFLDLPSEEL
jgi:hypothetical protein